IRAGPVRAEEERSRVSGKVRLNVGGRRVHDEAEVYRSGPGIACAGASCGPEIELSGAGSVREEEDLEPVGADRRPRVGEWRVELLDLGGGRESAVSAAHAHVEVLTSAAVGVEDQDRAGFVRVLVFARIRSFKESRATLPGGRV